MRWKKTIGIAVLLIAALAVSLYFVLSTYDYNRLKPQIAGMVKDATGRELRMDGDIKLAIGLSPALVVTDVFLANAAGGSQPVMARIEELRVQLKLLPLFYRELDLTHIGLSGVDLLLETDSDGRGNWEIPSADASSGKFRVLLPGQIQVDGLNLENMRLTIHKHGSPTDTKINVAHLRVERQGTQDGLSIDLNADYNGTPAALSGEIGDLRQLFAHRPFPATLSGKILDADVEIDGKIGDLLNLAGIDLEARLSGTNLAALKPVQGIQLPETSAFDLKGKLLGSKGSLALSHISGHLAAGGTDIDISGLVGDLIALSGIELALKGSGKNLAELEPIIGAKLPATDRFEIQGRLAGSTKKLALQKAEGSASRGSLHMAFSGEVKDLLTLEGLDLNSRLTGNDLTEFGEIIAEKLPATDKFEIQGRLVGSTEALALQKAEGSASRGSLALSVSGDITRLLVLEGINLRLDASGKELSEIGPLIGASLPGLGPFSLGGQLTGSTGTLAIDNLAAMVDKSDLAGIAQIEFRERPKITLRLNSGLIDFTPFLEKGERNTPAARQDRRSGQLLFSDARLHLEVLEKLDADVVLKAKNIHARDAHFQFGHFELKLEDKHLNLDIHEATYKEAKLTGNLSIAPESPPRIATKFLVQEFDLGAFLKEMKLNDEVRSVIDIAAYLDGRGDSVHSLMAGLNGSIGAVMGQGYLTKYLDLISIDLTQKVIEFWGRPKGAEQINCAVVQFDVQNGTATSKAFVFDSAAAILTARGDIDLGTEKVDFLLIPQPKRPGIMDLSTNLRVSGTIMEPKVRPDALSLATKGAKLLSVLALGPIGLLAPFVTLGAHQKHPCAMQGLGQEADGR